MYFYDAPFTDELEAFFLKTHEESKEILSVKQVASNSDMWGPTLPCFEFFSEARKREFTQHLIECYPTITSEQMATVDQELLMEVHKMFPSTPLKQAILIAQEAARQRGRLSSTPFYGNRATKYGQRYWVRMCASYKIADCLT